MRRIASSLYIHLQRADEITLLIKFLAMLIRGEHKVFSCIAGVFMQCLLLTNAYAVPPGTVISNTANANYDITGTAQIRTSNQVDITTTVILSPATISFLQYSPTGAGATATNSSPTGCSSTGISGPFNNLANPTYLGMGTLDVSVPVDLAQHQVITKVSQYLLESLTQTGT